MSLLTLSEQQKLVDRNLAIRKTNGNLVTFKYHRRVMYDYLWKKHPELMECRGHTYDVTTGELVLAAPTKSFNYLEDGWWSDVPLDTKVDIYKKFNGFLATVSVHKGEIIVGTTGTTNSDYAKMAREMIYKRWPEEQIKLFDPGNTWLFEICHPDDPHIVEENSGAKFLGDRDNKTGHYIPAVVGEAYFEITLEQALEIASTCKHEGFMVYDQQGNVCKLKSPYYVGKKKLMRANKDAVESMYRDTGKYISTNETFVNMWFDTIVKIVQTIDKDTWITYTDQQRRKIIEEME